MDTTTLTISLPEPLRAFVEEQAAQGGHGSPDEFVQALIRAEQTRQAEARLEALLLEGLRSEVGPMTPDDWEAIRREGRQRLAAQRTP